MKNFFKVQRKFKGGFKVRTLKVKSISVMLIFSMMLAMFMPLISVKVYAAPDTRTQITRINLHATSGTTVAEYGATITQPVVEIVSSDPTGAVSYLSLNGIANWFKNGEYVAPGNTFGEGNYYLQIRINLSGTGQGLYKWADDTEIMYLDGTRLSNSGVGDSYLINELEYTVSSTATTHKVTFNSNGGSAVAQQNVVHGGTITEPTNPTKNGYAFAGWYADSELTIPFDFSTAINNTTRLYAKWNVAHNVTFNLDGGTWTDTGTNPQVVNDGETAIRPTNPTKSGHVFAGWYADSACTTPFSFLTAITSNKTIYAKWDIITNSVNAILSPTPSVGLTIGDLVLTSGDSSKYSVSAGYWKLNDSGSALDKSSTQFEAGQTYTLYLTYYPENGYNIPDDATYTVNGIPTEWSGFEAKSNRKINFTIPAPATQISELSATVTAPVGGEHPSFTATVPDGAHYTAVVDTWYDLDNNGAHLTNSDTFVTDNEYQARIHFTANTGYEIANSASYTINGTPNYATFDTAKQRGMNFVATAPAVTTYTVTYDANGGTGSMADATGVSGEYILLANGFTAPDGKQFKAWAIGSVNGEQKQPGEQITITADTYIYAIWEEIPIEIPDSWNIIVTKTGVYNITPSKTLSGFNKDSITVYDKNNGIVKYNDTQKGWPLIGGQKYTIKLNTQFNNTENLDWNLTKRSGTLFPDTYAGDWYYDAVTYSVGSGIMSGYASNGKFGTSDSIQRQDFLVMLARYDGVDLTQYKGMSSGFKDVGKGSYYEAAVIWGVENGITTGYTDGSGKFGVGDKMTREQLVTFLCRYAKNCKGKNVNVSSAKKSEIKAKYKDFSSVSPFSQDAIYWAVSNGVINGKTDTTVVPQGNAQRCEVAKIMYNIYLNNTLN